MMLLTKQKTESATADADQELIATLRTALARRDELQTMMASDDPLVRGEARLELPAAQTAVDRAQLHVDRLSDRQRAEREAERRRLAAEALPEYRRLIAAAEELDYEYVKRWRAVLDFHHRMHERGVALPQAWPLEIATPNGGESMVEYRRRWRREQGV
jgi:hypothetical protein